MVGSEEITVIPDLTLTDINVRQPPTAEPVN